MSIVGRTLTSNLWTACTGHLLTNDTGYCECRETYTSSQDHSGLVVQRVNGLQTVIIHANDQTSMSDYADGWDIYLNHVEVAKATSEMKAQLTEAVLTLRKVLGEDWPSKSQDSDHPILWSLRMISGAMSNGILINWGGCVSALKDAKDLESLLAKLRCSGKARSAVAELEVAGRLAGNGCAVELEPKVGDKRPDMRCRCGDLEFLVEVKTLNTAPESWKAIKTLTDVTTACGSTSPVGIIFKMLAKPHLKEVTDFLALKTNRAASNRIPVEVHLDRVLKMYLVPDELPNRTELCAKWLRRQEDTGVMPRGGGMLGPPDNVSPEHRVRVRIDKFNREGQIPQGNFGILVITGHAIFGGADNAERFVDQIIENVYEMGNIPAVVLVTDKIVGDDEETTITDRRDFIFIRNKIYDGIHEEVILIKNRFCRFRLDYGRLASLLATKK